MKLGFTSLILPLALVCACEIVDISIPGVPRGYRTTAGGTPGNRSDSTGVPQGHAPDTAVLVCGVAVPDAYEWQKDTAMGAVQSRLVLYRDSALVLSLPIGAERHLNPYPDSHHLYGGHVYSEYTAGGRTWISADGEALFDYEGSEYLKGLAVKDGELFTLGCDPATGELTLRKDGLPLLRISGGKVFGGFGEDSPAIYRDGDGLCFAYSEGGAVHMVRDGVVSGIALPPGADAVEDFRVVDGEECAVFEKGGYVCCSYAGESFTISRTSSCEGDFHVVDCGAGAAVTGRLKSRTSSYSVYLRLSDPSVWFFRSGVSHILDSPGGVPSGVSARPYSAFAAGTDSRDAGGLLYSFGDRFLFTGEALAAADGHRYAGLSSSSGGRPCLAKDGATVREYPFNGYIACISLEITNSEDGSRQDAR